MSKAEKTDKTVAFFFVTSNDMIQVRQSSDYVPKMIELAGGTYIFENLGDEDTKRSVMTAVFRISKNWWIVVEFWKILKPCRMGTCGAQQTTCISSHCPSGT